MDIKEKRRLVTEYGETIERTLKIYVKKLCLKNLSVDEIVDHVMKAFALNICHFLQMVTKDDEIFRKYILRFSKNTADLSELLLKEKERRRQL